LARALSPSRNRSDLCAACVHGCHPDLRAAHVRESSSRNYRFVAVIVNFVMREHQCTASADNIVIFPAFQDARYWRSACVQLRAADAAPVSST
jgi:hypothetical protein